MMNNKKVPRLEIYEDSSILFNPDGSSEVFVEGKNSQDCKLRQDIIRNALRDGYFERLIDDCVINPEKIEKLDSDAFQTVQALVDSITSEVGRAVVGLAVLQLVVKSINNDQNIRLHKGGNGSNNFSWTEGLSMRTLDSKYITPVLRKYDLLKINKDGVFMTRSLAENYPYTKLYKAAIRGARDQWLDLIDMVETRKLMPLACLQNVILLLIQKQGEFSTLCEDLRSMIHSQVNNISTKDACNLIMGFVSKSDHSARLFEIAIFSFLLSVEDHDLLEGFLVPIGQMRSANKKHGNVGDIEIAEDSANMHIVEAWDAKYGKPYLRDEIEELDDKLINHPNIGTVGFITDGDPDMKDEIVNRKTEIEFSRGVKLEVLSFSQWIEKMLSRYSIEESTFGYYWVKTFSECICLKRIIKAPIDEPTYAWVKNFHSYLKSFKH